jgi:hypothetical protein
MVNVSWRGNEPFYLKKERKTKKSRKRGREAIQSPK